MNRARTLLVAAATMAVLTAGSAAGAQLDGTMTARGSVAIEGATQAALEASALETGRACSLSMSGATVHVMESTAIRYQGSPSGPPGSQYVTASTPERETESFDFGGRMTWSDDALVRVVKHEGFELRTTMDPLVVRPPAYGEAGESEPAWKGQRLAWGSGDGIVDVTSAPAIHGAVLVALQGNITFDGEERRQVQAGFEEVQRIGPHPTNSTATLGRFRTIIVDQAALGHTQCAWDAHVKRLHASRVERMRFVDVAVDAAANGTLVRDDAGLLLLTGDVDALGEWRGNVSEWHVHGEVHQLRLDNSQRILPSIQSIMVPVAAAATLVVMARLATFIGGALVARVADPGSHPTRARLLAMIAEEPGQTEADLAKAAGLSRATTSFHLAVLRRTHQVKGYREGRRIHYTLNSGSFDRPVDGPAGVPLSTFAVVLRNPIRRRLLEILAAAPSPLRPREVLAQWGKDPPGRTLVGFHAEVLRRAGVIAIRHDARSAMWAATVRGIPPPARIEPRDGGRPPGAGGPALRDRPYPGHA